MFKHIFKSFVLGDFRIDLTGYQSQQRINLEALEKNLPVMRSYIDRLNGAHNTAFKQEIKEHEDFMRRIMKRAK